MKKLRYLAEATLVYFLMGIFRILPVETASNLGCFIGRNIAYQLSASRKAKRHVIDSLHLNSNDTDRIVKGMWENLGRLFAEYPHLRNIYTKRTELMGIENLGNLPNQPNAPVVFFGGHLANWEVAAPTITPYIPNLGLVYRPPNNPYVQNILDKCRSLDGSMPIFPKSNNGMRQLMASLKKGGRVGILIDQKYNQGVEADFFGKPAMTSMAFIQLAKKFNCPLIPVQVERLENARFRVTIHQPMDLTKDDMTLLTEAHTMLEGWIRQHPEQWIWLHKRWKPQEDVREHIPVPSPQ